MAARQPYTVESPPSEHPTPPRGTGARGAPGEQTSRTAHREPADAGPDRSRVQRRPPSPSPNPPTTSLVQAKSGATSAMAEGQAAADAGRKARRRTGRREVGATTPEIHEGPSIPVISGILEMVFQK